MSVCRQCRLRSRTINIIGQITEVGGVLITPSGLGELTFLDTIESIFSCFVHVQSIVIGKTASTWVIYCPIIIIVLDFGLGQ